MEQNPTLSISIVNTNNCSLVRDCLNSIYQNTTRTTFEIIVVDNASNDGSVEMIEREFPLVRLVKNVMRQGYGYSHNRGVEVSKGEFVLIFNEDMVVLPNALDLMFEKIKSNPQIGVVGCRLLNSDGSLQHSCFKFFTLWGEALEALIPYNLFFKKSKWRRQMMFWDHNQEREVDVVMGCCMLVPRKIFESAGKFDPHFFVYSEESDLCRRIKNLGYKVVFIPDAKIIHIGGQTSKTMSLKMNLVMAESKIKYVKKHHGELACLCARAIWGIGSLIRIIGWSGYWLMKGKQREEAGKNVVRYSKTLGVIMDWGKP